MYVSGSVKKKDRVMLFNILPDINLLQEKNKKPKEIVKNFKNYLKVRH